MNSRSLVLLFVVLTACQSTVGHRSGVDHIILGAANLEAGMAAFEKATGVMPVRGGAHPGRGTQNALVSLGDATYLELRQATEVTGSGSVSRYIRHTLI